MWKIVLHKLCDKLKKFSDIKAHYSYDCLTCGSKASPPNQQLSFYIPSSKIKVWTFFTSYFCLFLFWGYFFLFLNTPQFNLFRKLWKHWQSLDNTLTASYLSKINYNVFLSYIFFNTFFGIIIRLVPYMFLLFQFVVTSFGQLVRRTCTFGPELLRQGHVFQS